jgi:hypothetical protein
MMHCEDHAISLAKLHDFSPRLHPWPLFHQHELTASEILARDRQEKRNLQRENEIAINVLMEAIEVVFILLQQKRSGPNLSRPVALFQKGCMRRRVSHIDRHDLVPAIGDCRRDFKCIASAHLLHVE